MSDGNEQLREDVEELRDTLLANRRTIESLTRNMTPETAAPYLEGSDRDLAALDRLAAALSVSGGGDENERLRAACPLCGHAWRRHDPEDGCCDAHSDEPGIFGPCECGRDVVWMQRKIAALSRAALAEGEPATETTP